MGTKKRFPGLFYREVQMHSQDAAKLNDAIKANEGYTKKISYLAKVDDPEVYPQVKNLHERVHGDGVGESTWFKKTVEENLPPLHTVTFSCTNGSVGATVDGMEIQSGAQVREGKSVIFTITPDEGYEYTGTNPETVVVNADVTKAYVCIVLHTVTFSCTNGSVGATVDGVGIQSPAQVAEGKSVVFTITPDEGYEYTGTNPETVVVTADVTKAYECTQAIDTRLKFVLTSQMTLGIHASGGVRYLQYSTDNGETWGDLQTDDESSASVPAGTVLIKAPTDHPFTGREDAKNYISLTGSGTATLSGDITYLLNGVGGVTDLTTYGTYALAGIFYENEKIVDASGLILPPTTLTTGCYGWLFAGCTSLTNAHFTLPATALVEYCYTAMFQVCSDLITPPIILATSVASDNSYCCQNMFDRCTSLTESPVLNIETIGRLCYNSMFSGCSSLVKMTCNATDKSAVGCTYNWLSGVAASGDFYGKTAAGWTTGTDGIPSGWTAHLD